MAVPQNTLTGKTRGSVGNTTFTTWKGVNVLKSKPVSVANPRTQGQVNQRTILANFVMLYRLISAIFNAGFKQLAVKQSAYNAAASVNMQNGAIGSDSSILVQDVTLLQIAKGSLYPSPLTTADADFSLKTVRINWETSTFADQLNTDKAYAIAFSEAGEAISEPVLGTATRADGAATIDFPDMPAAGQNVYVYLFFVQTSTGKVSNSAVRISVVVA